MYEIKDGRRFLLTQTFLSENVDVALKFELLATPLARRPLLYNSKFERFKFIANCLELEKGVN